MSPSLAASYKWGGPKRLMLSKLATTHRADIKCRWGFISTFRFISPRQHQILRLFRIIYFETIDFVPNFTRPILSSLHANGNTNMCPRAHRRTRRYCPLVARSLRISIQTRYPLHVIPLDMVPTARDPLMHNNGATLGEQYCFEDISRTSSSFQH